MLVDVKRWRVLGQHTLQPPLGEGLGGAGIAVVEFVVARLLSPQLQTDDVLRMLLVIACLILRRDDIVWWRDERGNILLGRISYAWQRSDIRHCKLLYLRAPCA